MPLAIPTPDEVRTRRLAAGLSQTEACQLVSDAGDKGYRTWQRYEAPSSKADHRRIPAGLWELFLLKTNQHPSFALAKRKPEAAHAAR